MKKNMGAADRIVRTIIAVVIAVLYFTDVITGTWGIVFLILAGVFLLTSLFSFCPLYLPFGLSTCRTKEA
ncbi:MAG: YgaP family membrane protein [Bacteroidales bacterium]